MSVFQNREILIGVTGGIAAYKTADLTSKLVQAGASVTVAMTEAAKKFIGPTTFEALTNRPVYQNLFEPVEHPQGEHIGLARRADPVFVAPAMNTEMWNKPSVQRNIQQLKEDGLNFVEPGSGWLSCGQVGAGRMAEPVDILEQLRKHFESLSSDERIV